MKTRVFSWTLSLLAAIFALLLGGWRSDTYFEKPSSPVRKPAAKVAEATLPPHSSQFKFTSLHGSDFVSNPQVCKKCHGADLKGGAFQSSCLKCHPVLGKFAHFAGDITKIHGAAYLQNPAGCQGCHGSALEGRDRATGCANCHNYPHSPRWSLPTEHGQAFIKLYHEGQIQDCLRCHSKEGEFRKKYPEKFLACDHCHLELPHRETEPGRWARSEHKTAAMTYEGKCGVCHKNYKSNMPRFKNCKICHGASAGKAKRYEQIAKFEKLQNRSYASEADHSSNGIEPIRVFWGAE